MRPIRTRMPRTDNACAGLQAGFPGARASARIDKRGPSASRRLRTSGPGGRDARAPGRPRSRLGSTIRMTAVQGGRSPACGPGRTNRYAMHPDSAAVTLLDAEGGSRAMPRVARRLRAGSSPALRPPCGAARPGRRLRRGRGAPQLSLAEHPLPQPLAALRDRRHRSDHPVARRYRRCRAGAHPVRPRGHERAPRCGSGGGLAVAGARYGSRARAVRGPRRREPAPVRLGRALLRSRETVPRRRRRAVAPDGGNGCAGVPGR